jgi:hypothetical protein
MVCMFGKYDAVVSKKVSVDVVRVHFSTFVLCHNHKMQTSLLYPFC